MSYCRVDTLVIFLAFGDIIERWRIGADPDSRNAMDRGIGVLAGTAMGPEAVGFAVRSRDRRRPAERGKSGFGRI